jgi:dTDP-4-dehydrorhamnose 3,5-epimerase
MKVETFRISGLKLIEPRIFKDSRGYFYESWNAERYWALGLPDFVQDNLSRSARGVFRGLHLQYRNAQAKLVSCICGSIRDFAVDLRKDSPTFGQWEAVTLSGCNKKQLFLPEGFAHGFYVNSETALVTYKAAGPYSPEYEVCLRASDPALGISLPGSPIISEKDKQGITLKEFVERYLPLMDGEEEEEEER